MMRIKMDENVDARLAVLLRDEGHDANTVREQGLHGIEDEALYEFCKKEDRLMVTLDLDFSNTIRFPPEGTPGAKCALLSWCFCTNSRSSGTSLTWAKVSAKAPTKSAENLVCWP